MQGEDVFGIGITQFLDVLSERTSDTKSAAKAMKKRFMGFKWIKRLQKY